MSRFRYALVLAICCIFAVSASAEEKAKPKEEEALEAKIEELNKQQQALRAELEALRDKKRAHLVTVTYDMEDLLMASMEPPKARPQPDKRDGTGPGSLSGGVSMDYDMWIDLILDIAPESWEGQGGYGTISPFPTNLSIVISQTEPVHQKISEYLGEIRTSVKKLQDSRLRVKITANIPDDEKNVTKVYNVTDLVESQWKEQHLRDEFLDKIIQTLYPHSWQQRGGKGIITFQESRLIVKQSEKVHRSVTELIEKLRQRQSAKEELSQVDQSRTPSSELVDPNYTRPDSIPTNYGRPNFTPTTKSKSWFER